MRLGFLFVVLLTLSACGNDKKSSKDPVSVLRQEEAVLCDLNGTKVSCESLEGPDGMGIDLLESTVDVSVNLTEYEVVFRETKTQTAQGRRISCKTSVRSGEVYKLIYTGSNLDVINESGETIRYERLNEGDSILGAWVSRTYVDSGTHIIRQMTFVSHSHAILKTHCEF